MPIFFRHSLLVGCFSILFFMQASAKIPAFFQIDVEQVFKAQELPDTAYLLLENGTYMDLGIFYKQLTVFFIPVWNYEIQWCGYVGNDTQLLTLDEEALEGIVQATGLSLAHTPSLPFWPSIGGKLLFLVFVGVVGSFILFYKNKKKTASTNPSMVHNTAPLVELPPNKEEAPET